MSQVLVVADDLTGGNATGALFARRGLRTISVASDPAHWGAAAGADVIVVNTDTRRAAAPRAADLVTRVVTGFRPAPLLLVTAETAPRSRYPLITLFTSGTAITVMTMPMTAREWRMCSLSSLSILRSYFFVS